MFARYITAFGIRLHYLIEKVTELRIPRVFTNLPSSLHLFGPMWWRWALIGFVLDG
ncbi:hypothetical protein D3C80_1919710 [compost metagenome]